MYTNTGYLNLEDSQLEDMTVPLRVNCCGVYRLVTRPSMYTLRPYGRPDYQLLYIASGRAWFTAPKGIDKEMIGESVNIAPSNELETFSEPYKIKEMGGTWNEGDLPSSFLEVPAGSMILYTPREYQQYVYYLKDKPEVFWVHFTGSEAGKLLSEAGFGKDPIQYTGNLSGYQQLFLSMIRELQLPRPFGTELSSLYFRELLCLIRRQNAEGGSKKPRVQKEMEHAVHFFHENFTREISIEEYAKDLHMSTCWFIRSFKQYVGMPPRQYLTSIRITKAKELLESTSYTVSEIGAIVGYDNPLYFSRIFKKQTGLSPAEYRKALS